MDYYQLLSSNLNVEFVICPRILQDPELSADQNGEPYYSTQGHSLSQKQANGFLVINKSNTTFNFLQDLVLKQKDKSQFDSGLK